MSAFGTLNKYQNLDCSTSFSHCAYSNFSCFGYFYSDDVFLFYAFFKLNFNSYVHLRRERYFSQDFFSVKCLSENSKLIAKAENLFELSAH